MEARVKALRRRGRSRRGERGVRREGGRRRNIGGWGGGEERGWGGGDCGVEGGDWVRRVVQRRWRAC